MDKRTINVVWKTYHAPEVIGRGYWDQGLLEDIFAQIDEVEFVHHDSVDSISPDEGAVFILNGRTHVDDVSAINADINKLRWVLFIDTGDEEARFPWREIQHPIMRVWMMLPRMNIHDDTHYKLVNGYRPQTREVLKKIGYKEKTQDWFFAGQVNHERREQCVHELKLFLEPARNLYPNGTLITTDGFGKEVLNYEQYLDHMAMSKIVLCPSGIESPDNFRLYEALEAGCVPVVDAFSTKHKHPGFWRYLLGDDIPFPIVDYWDALPKLMPELLREYPTNANKIFSWWQQRKRALKWQLIDDVMELSR